MFYSECAKYFVISGILENNFSFGLGYSLPIILAMANVLGKIDFGLIGPRAGS